MTPSILRRASMMAAVLSVCLAGTSRADVVFELDLGIKGDFPVKVDNSLPALRAVFQNNGANTVKLTMDASNLIDSQYLRTWLFNFDGNAMSLTIFPFPAVVSSVVRSATQSLSGGDDVGAGLFNIAFHFNTASDSSRFDGGQTHEATITGAGLDESMFSILSADKPDPNGSAGGWYSASYVLNIPDGTSFTSGSLGARPRVDVVPEPGALALAAVGLAGFTVLFRRRNRAA